MMEEPKDGDSESDVEPEPGTSTSHHHLSSSSRQMRNEAEKKRRDTLNGYITELGRLVPTVDSTPRRIDKISILRLAATYLMQNQILHRGRTPEKPFLPVSLHMYNLSLSMVEDMDAFLLVVTSAGKIVFVSHTVEKLLGHAQIDMFGQSLYNFTLKEDHPVLTFNLQPNGNVEAVSEGDADAGSGDDTSCSSESSLSPPPASNSATANVNHETQRRSFFLQLSQRCVSRSEQPEYKRVHLLGNLRVPQNPVMNRRPRRQTGDWLGGEGISNNESVLVAIVKLDSRIRELSILEANRDEYVTRHLIDGRIIYSDHRISLVAGYLTEEVNGMSAFKFMHQEDVMFAIVALRQMYDRGEGFGWSCYRLQSKTGQFIYLRTHGYLEKNEENNEVESFICINTLMREEDGKRLIQEMKTRYSANLESTRTTTNALVEKEMQLDEVITQLIPAAVEPPTVHSPFPDSQYMKAMFSGKSLPPASVHSIQAGLGSPKSSARVTSETSLDAPGPSGISRPSPDSSRNLGSPGGNGRITRHGLRSPKVTEHAERPSVITSGVRRRRHDSDNLASVKRRRSPQHEELVIQVPPQMSPEELSHAILSRGQNSSDQTFRRAGSTEKQPLYSPPIKTRRYTHSPDLALTTTLPGNFLSTDTGQETVGSSYHTTHIHDYPQNTSDVKLSKGDLLSPNQSSFTNTDAILSPNQTPCRNMGNLSSPSHPYNNGSFLSPNQTPCVNSTDTLLSPSKAIHTNSDDLLDPSQALRTNQTVRTNRDSTQVLYSKRHLRSNSSQALFINQDKAVPAAKDDSISPSEVLCPVQDVHGPISVAYSSKVVTNTDQGSFQSQVTLTPETGGESLYTLDVSSRDHSQYLIESMLNQSDLMLPEMEQVQVPTSTDNHNADTPLYLIVEQSHSQLESNLQIQQMQITSIKQDIKQVPKPHSDQVFKNFTELEDEHKQNQHLLHILKQDISRTCP